MKKLISAIGFDEYVDVVNQIEKLNIQINKENRSITEKEAKKEITLLIRLLEFENIKVEVQQEATNIFWAKTKNNEYDCHIIEDLPTNFLISSIDNMRKIESSYLNDKSFKHHLSIDLDEKWYVDRINDWLNNAIERRK